MSPLPHPNAGLIGAPLSALSTPFLMIDRAALEANLDAMAAFAREAGIALRPHAKTHKSATLAKAQTGRGALGVCCAKLGEAEALAGEGVRGLLLTSPIVAAPVIRRLMALLKTAPDTMAVIDNEAAAEALSAAAVADGVNLTVLVDLDIGLHRTGIAPPRALMLGERIARLPGLRLKGLQAYAGHLMHIEDAAERREKSLAGLAQMAQVRDAFDRAGLDVSIRSGGGTGTYDIDVDAGVLTELQVGSYLFMDKQYLDVHPAQNKDWRFRPSLYVLSSVISTGTAGIATTDAGFKAFATDAGAPLLAGGAPEGASYFYFGDEQGGIAFADKDNGLPLGAQVRCVVPHCDPTVNLYDVYHVVASGKLEALWPIEARGRVS